MHPSPLSAGGEGVGPPAKFSKESGLIGRGRGGGGEGDVFQQGREPNFYMKNKSRIFNDKKSL